MAGIFDIKRHNRQFIWHLRFQIDQLAEEFLNGAHQRFHLQVVFNRLWNHFHAGAQVRLILDKFHDAHAFHTLHQETDRPVWRLEHTMDLRSRTNQMNLIGLWLFDRLIFAGDQRNNTVAGQVVFHQTNTAFLADGQR